MLVKSEDGEVLEGFLKSLSPGEVKFCRETAIAKNTNLGPVNSKRQKESLGRVMISDPSCLEEMSSEKFKGVPFREAHSITGKIVGYCIEHQTFLQKLTLKELHKFSHKFSEDVYELLDPHKSIEHKKSSGSTAPNEVKKQIVYWTRVLKQRK